MWMCEPGDEAPANTAAGLTGGFRQLLGLMLVLQALVLLRHLIARPVRW